MVGVRASSQEWFLDARTPAPLLTHRLSDRTGPSVGLTLRGGAVLLAVWPWGVDASALGHREVVAAVDEHGIARPVGVDASISLDTGWKVADGAPAIGQGVELARDMRIGQ